MTHPTDNPLSERSVAVDLSLSPDLPKLLRAIAYGTQAKENGHDIILNTAIVEMKALNNECVRLRRLAEERLEAVNSYEKLKAQHTAITEALILLERGLRSTGGCSDGYCLISPQEGMHTNGGCNCHYDHNRARIALARYRHFFNAVSTALKESSNDR